MKKVPCSISLVAEVKDDKLMTTIMGKEYIIAMLPGGITINAKLAQIIAELFFEDPRYPVSARVVDVIYRNTHHATSTQPNES